MKKTLLRYKPDSSYALTETVEITKEEAIIISNLIINRSNEERKPSELTPKREKLLDKLVSTFSLDVV